MEYNAFTEGVRPGSVTTSHEVMILICYLIDQAGQPVSFQELSAALQGQELVNYFQLVEAVDTLGAGDSYIAGFLTGLWEGRTIEGAMERGAACATETLGYFGAW